MERHRLLASGVLGALAALISLGPVFADESRSDGPTAIGVGAQIFADTGLSASGDLACATCHDPANAHAQNNDLAVQLGGANRDVPGFRAVPSLRYVSFTPKFAFDDEGTRSADSTATDARTT